MYNYLCLQANLQGDTVDPGTTSLGINKPSYSLHAAIHAARPDVKAIIHLNTPTANAVSTLMLCFCFGGGGGLRYGFENCKQIFS